MLLSLLTLQVLATAPSADPFAFLLPSVTVTADERRQLDRGEPVARVLPATELEVAVFAAVPVRVGGDRLVAWVRRIEQLKKGGYVLAMARFSDLPRMADLEGLVLDDEELSAILSCRPGDCGLKLSAGEMTELQRAATGTGRDRQAQLQQAFRAMVLDRVKAYLAEGHAGLAPYADHKDPVRPAARFVSLMGHSAFVTTHLPRLSQQLSHDPQTPAPALESFVYWSKERLAGKPIVSATHVIIFRGDEPSLPDVFVAGKTIFATHYVNASLGITTIVRGEPGAHNYLAYVNRSEVDKAGGMFDGLVRWFLQRRLKAEAANVLQEIRRRLESGEPPPIEARGPP